MVHMFAGIRRTTHIKPLEFGRGDSMDGTWRPPDKEIKYVVCQACKELVKKKEIIRNGLKICSRCAEV